MKSSIFVAEKKCKNIITIKVIKIIEMKLKNLIIASVVLTTIFTSCVSEVSDYMGNWVTKAYFSGRARAEGTSFEINNFGYYGMGRNYNDYLSDFWKYDPINNSWEQVADFPGTPRAYGVSASSENFGYAGLGYDGNNKVDLGDFWKYDPQKNEWTNIEDFPGGERRYATAFSIGNDIYVGTGTQEDDEVYTNDFYKYDGSSWEQIPQLTGQKRRNATTTSLNGKGYLIGGNRNGVLNDFWRYDPETQQWEELRRLNHQDYGKEDVPRYNAVAYSADNKLYLVAGNTNSSTTSTCFEWDPQYEEWIQKTSIETNISREGAGSFVLNGYGYIVGGRNGTSSSSYRDDLYMFQPNVEANQDDN